MQPIETCFCIVKENGIVIEKMEKVGPWTFSLSTADVSVQVAVAFMSNQLSTVLQGRGNGIKILNVERVYVNFFLIL